MAICKCMIHAFMYGWENDSYGEYDLKVGIQYAKDLIRFEKLKKEPMHGYDLKKFIKWCENKLTLSK